MKNSPVNVHAIGLDSRGIKTLDYFFKKYCDGRGVMVTNDKAEVYMINMDAVGSEKKLKELKASSPLSPIILMALSEIKLEPYYFVRKPLIAKHLLKVLSDIEKSPNRQLQNTQDKSEQADDYIEKNSTGQTLFSTTNTAGKIQGMDAAHFVGNSIDIDLADSGDKSGIYFDPERYYLGHIREAIQQAVEKNCSVQVTGRSHKAIFSPNNELVCIDLSDNKLRHFAVTALYSKGVKSKERNKFSYQYLSDSEALEYFKKNSDSVQKLCPFMWKLSLWTSRGRLPKELPLDSPLFIRNWPNFTRLAEIPHALRVVASWLPKPKSIIELSNSLSIEQRYTFSIITATYMTGLSKIADSGPHSEALSTNSSNKVVEKKSLFSRLIKKLRY